MDILWWKIQLITLFKATVAVIRIHLRILVLIACGNDVKPKKGHNEAKKNF